MHVISAGPNNIAYFGFNCGVNGTSRRRAAIYSGENARVSCERPNLRNSSASLTVKFIFNEANSTIGYRVSYDFDLLLNKDVICRPAKEFCGEVTPIIGWIIDIL